MKLRFLFATLPFLSLLPMATAHASPSKPVCIVLIGDSTVTRKSKKNDEAGWGWALQQQTKPDAVVYNLAVGGRSSRSFRSEGRWDKALQRKPEWVLIQFGHNDQPGKGPERESKPESEYRDHLREYIAEARANGAKPILLTPVCRYTFGADGKLADTLAPYAEAVRIVGEETNTPVLDLHAYSYREFTQMGKEGVTKLSPPEVPTDRTHFSTGASKLIAQWVLQMLKEQVPELGAHFEDIPLEATSAYR